MKRFEIPEMEINRFDVENVVTNGSEVTPSAPKTAVEKARAAAESEGRTIITTW